MSDPTSLTAEALARVQLGKPATYGGAIRNAALSETMFLTQTVPDVNPNTRILAVCGITDHYDNASPKKDGWFYSDFYAFNYLLRGQGVSQTWVSSENPQNLVNKYKEYLHGSEYKPRKIVLNDNLLRDNPPQGINVVGRYNMVPNFLSMLEHECNLARRNQQAVLILLFGHGDSTSKGVELGLAGLVPTLEYPLLEMEDFRLRAGTDVQLTVFSTACYSGGWSVNPQLNTTTLTGAGPGPDPNNPKYLTGQSESWPFSQSVGRACGSIYATAVIQALSDEDAPYVEMAYESGSSSDEVRVNTYSTFAHTIYQVLFTRVNRWAAVHDIRFSAQEDEWNMGWHQRTGLSLADYASRWASLEEVLPADPSAFWSRDPLRPDLIEDLSQVPRGQTGSCDIDPIIIGRMSTGKLTAVKSMVQAHARMYMASFPGRDNIASNGPLHGAIARLQKNQDFTFQELSEVYTQLEYRLNAMKAADYYIGALGLHGPDGLKCANWDMAKTPEVKNLSQEHFQNILAEIDKAGLFPRPIEQQGRPFSKVNNYMAISLLAAKTDISTLPVILEELVNMKNKAISDQVNELSRFRTIKTAGRNYFATLGKRLRSLSPVKRERTKSDPATQGRRRSILGRYDGPGSE